MDSDINKRLRDAPSGIKQVIKRRNREEREREKERGEGDTKGGREREEKKENNCKGKKL